MEVRTLAQLSVANNLAIETHRKCWGPMLGVWEEVTYELQRWRGGTVQPLTTCQHLAHHPESAEVTCLPNPPVISVFIGLNPTSQTHPDSSPSNLSSP